MSKSHFIILISLLSCPIGCSSEEPPHFDGSSCGSSEIEFLGILGDNSLSDKRAPNADQRGRYSKYHICPDDYPYCVYLQNGSILDESAGVMCSSCKQGQLLCDADSGSKECTEVLHNKQHCGGCNQPCEGVCVDGKCSVNECGYGAISCEAISEDGSVRNICINPLSDLTCGATCENPGGEKCVSDRECRDGQCLCRPNTVDCNSECVNLNANKTCGLTCESMVACKTSEGQECRNGICVCPDNLVLCDGHCVDFNSNNTCGTSCEDMMSCHADESQTCIQNKCTCPDGLLMREGHCIDPMRNNKYCGANDSDNLNGEICITENNITCQNGKCTCPAGLLRNHSNECINPDSDIRYCGAVQDNYGYAIENSYLCGENKQCEHGECVCITGYRMNNNGLCIKNDDAHCGAKGLANADSPLDDNYKGYVCPNDTTCGLLDVSVRQNDIITSVSVNICRGESAYEFCGDSPSILGLNEESLRKGACADPNIYNSCAKHENAESGDEYYTCKCTQGYSNALCEIDNDCASVTCPETFECKVVDNEARCVCPEGFVKIKIDNKNVCKEQTSLLSDRAFCGTDADNVIACATDEMCENGKCAKCTSSQTMCIGECIENYDLNTANDTLMSLSDRHISRCSLTDFICELGYSNCNDSILDGCESDLTSNRSCGSCGNVCPVDATCTDGKCCLEPDHEYTEDLVNGADPSYKNAKCCDSTASRLCARVSIASQHIYYSVFCREKCIEDREQDVTDEWTD